MANNNPLFLGCLRSLAFLNGSHCEIKELSSLNDVGRAGMNFAFLLNRIGTEPIEACRAVLSYTTIRG